MSLFTLFKDWMTKPRPVERVLTETLSEMMPTTPVHVALGVVAEAPRKDKGGTLGMQGYAPIVKVSKHRHGARCICGEVVLRGVRHVCIYNAEHHLHSLSVEERERLIQQLEQLRVNKLNEEKGNELLIQRARSEQGRDAVKGGRGIQKGGRVAAGARGRPRAGVRSSQRNG